MRFSDYIRLAFKNLSRQKTRSFLTVIAITVGSLSLILMTSIIVSIKQTLSDQFKNLGAFDLVTVVKDPNSVNTNSLLAGSTGDPSEGKLIDDSALLLTRNLLHVSRATQIISNFGIGTMRLDGGNKKTWANIVAYDPDNDVFNLPVSYGRKLVNTDMDKIIIGNRFIQDVGYKGSPQDLIGKKILFNYRTGPGNAPDWGPPPEKPPANVDKDWYESKGKGGIDIPVEIVGITQSGAIDDGQSYVNIFWARHLMVNVSWQHEDCQKDKPCSDILHLVKEDNFLYEGYSAIILKADDPANIGAVADEVKQLGYGANTAKAMLDQINRILFIISIVLATVGGISLFVATIGIVNTMIMATYERTREIGVLRACGATRATIRYLFMTESALLGFLGGVFGMFISLIFGQLARLLIQGHAVSLGSLPLEHIGNFPLWLIMAVISFTTVIGILSGLFPAIRASRLNPTEALRYE